jgi:hypothetical protein
MQLEPMFDRWAMIRASTLGAAVLIWASGCSGQTAGGAAQGGRSGDAAVAGAGGRGAGGNPASAGGGSAGLDAGVSGDGAAPAGFWDASGIPPAKNVLMFKFLNRTNGMFNDGELYWSFKSGSISETHSFAEQPTYDMPANSSGRMYFYVCSPAAPVSCTGDPTKSKFFDFIEFTIGAAQYNGNTTRVDAFGLKLATRLHCADGYDVAVGED